MTDTGNMLTAIHALISAKLGSIVADGVDRGILVMSGLLDDAGRITDRGHAWLAMIEATPLPVQQWIDPRASLRAAQEAEGMFSPHKADPAAMRAYVAATVASMQPELPPLPDGFTAWGGELGTVFDKELKADVKVTVPNGIGVDTNVVVFQRNGKVRDVKGQQRFPAGTINWEWAKAPDPAMIPPGQEKKAADRFARQQAEDVIGYAIIPGEDDHLRRDIKR